MSHIAFDLDALPLVPKVARSAGVGESVVGWGLTQMWEWCWREKTDRVTTNHLRGFFGSELGAILVDFGFLAAAGSGLWRVKGAARYLRISQAQSAGGKKSKGNLKQYREPVGEPATSSGSPPAHHRLEPEATRSEQTGSTATSDERRATSDERLALVAAKKPRPAKTKPVDPRFGPLVGALKAKYLAVTGRTYVFTEGDGAAVKTLIARADDEEILRRFERGLRASQYEAKCASVLQLLQRWNELGVERGTGPDPNGGIIARMLEQTLDCAACGGPASAKFAEVPLCYGRCMTAAKDWAESQKPEQPWLADVAHWAELQKHEPTEDPRRRELYP